MSKGLEKVMEENGLVYHLSEDGMCAFINNTVLKYNRFTLLNG